MTDLTDKWKKGELKEGEYWCEITESPYVERVYLPCCDDIIVEVLAPVPSYGEWRELSKQRNRLIRDINGLAYIQEENTNLKGLLKECKGLFNRSTVDGAEPSNGELIMILTKIEQALGEDKCQ